MATRVDIAWITPAFAQRRQPRKRLSDSGPSISASNPSRSSANTVAKP